jgi:hypothetical protein
MREYRSTSLVLLTALACAPLIAGLTSCTVPMQATDAQTADDDAQVLFDSPQDAAVALVEAVRARDREALRAVIGPDFDRLSSGDLDIDDEDLQRFTAAYDRKNALIDHGNNTYTLVMGPQEWEFPAPIVGLNGKWWFDGEQGVEEVLNRVIGEHELQTIEVCARYPLIQQAYFDLDADGDGVKSYATKIKSSEGKRDGLYWPDAPGQPLSPIGPAVATAYQTGELSEASAKPNPYNGYFYRVLTKQGPGAPGGAMDYVDESGRMTRGFALIAWPAAYDDSGITSFIVGPDGIVYQRDLGEKTIEEAAKIAAYDPTGWTRVGADGLPVPEAAAATGTPGSQPPKVP